MWYWSQVCHLWSSPTRRKANFGIDVECDTHIFDGTHYAWWKLHMLDHFCAFGPKFWWIIVVGFTHDLDESNLTQAQGIA
jgi:hypothetical protein